MLIHMVLCPSVQLWTYVFHFLLLYDIQFKGGFKTSSIFIYISVVFFLPQICHVLHRSWNSLKFVVAKNKSTKIFHITNGFW